MSLLGKLFDAFNEPGNNKVESRNTSREVWIIKEGSRTNHELQDIIKTFLGESAH